MDSDARDSAAVAIQSHCRGQQGRKEAAVQRLLGDAEAAAEFPELGRLELDVGDWLADQGQESLVDALRNSGATTLRDLVQTFHEPADWATFVPDDADRCDELWNALQAEASQARLAAQQVIERHDAAKRLKERQQALERLQSEVDSTWRAGIGRAEHVEQKLSRDAQERSANRRLAHMAQMQAQRMHASEMTRQQRRSQTHRAWHEQACAWNEQQLQARETAAAATRLQRSQQRHMATQQWRSDLYTRTRQMIASPRHSPGAPGRTQRALRYSTGPPSRVPTFFRRTPEGNRQEELMRARRDEEQVATAKKRFAREQLPHEQTFVAHENRYRRVRAIKTTVAAKELCDRHQIDKAREFVFSEGRPTLQLTMRTTMGLQLAQKSRG